MPSPAKTKPKRRPLVIGITGGIASGKSTVSKICESFGATVIDADILGHRSYEKGTPCYRRLLKAFGDGIRAEDGSINRRALGSVVFSSPEKRRKLEEIVWPEIRRLMELDVQALGETGRSLAVVEAAVMLEAGWESSMDEVWVVAVDPAIAKERLMKRNGWPAEEAERRMASQMGNVERNRKADRVIWNNTTKEELERQVALAWKDRGTLRAAKAAEKARWRIAGATLGFSILVALLARRSRVS